MTVLVIHLPEKINFLSSFSILTMVHGQLGVIHLIALTEQRFRFLRRWNGGERHRHYFCVERQPLNVSLMGLRTISSSDERQYSSCNTMQEAEVITFILNIQTRGIQWFENWWRCYI